MVYQQQVCGIQCKLLICYSCGSDMVRFSLQTGSWTIQILAYIFYVIGFAEK